MFAGSAKTAELRERLLRFMDEHIYPNEAALFGHEHGPDRWQPPALVETLKDEAKRQGLWNLFLPDSEHGAGLSNLDYAHLCGIMGRSPFAPEIFNCAAPDTGNMEVLARYGTEEQKRRWLLRNRGVGTHYRKLRREGYRRDPPHIRKSGRARNADHQ